MMSELKETVSDWDNEGQVKDYLARLLKKEAFDRSGLIYGIGHAVYTKSDHRCELLKEKASELAEQTGRMDEFELYKTVEKLAPVVFKEIKKNYKDLCANVDFYSGFVYEMLGIPKDIFT